MVASEKLVFSRDQDGVRTGGKQVPEMPIIRIRAIGSDATRIDGPAKDNGSQ